MNKQNYIDHAEQALLHTYNRFPVVLDHGEGVYLYDTDGKKYLDFAAGIAVCAFGYGKKEYNDALKNQVDKLLHTSNLYYNVPTMEAAEKALAAADMDRIFFTNSGTEAIEGALKAAKKYGIPVRIAHSHNSENMGNKLVLISHLQHKKIISKYVTHFFACSDVAGAFMFGDNIVKQNNYCLINNAIETDKYSYNENIRMKTRLDLKISDKIVITNVGRFHFQKNHSFLVNVFSEFYKKYPTSVLLLIGDGELMEEVKNQVKKLGLTDCVMFLGNRGDVDRLMQAADLLLMPSRFEGLPVSAIEAQASGLPCLFSDTITSQVKITESVKFESLEAPLEKWVEDMEELLKEHRKDTRAQIISAGYDIEENAEHIFERFL